MRFAWQTFTWMNGGCEMHQREITCQAVSIFNAALVLTIWGMRTFQLGGCGLFHRRAVSFLSNTVNKRHDGITGERAESVVLASGLDRWTVTPGWGNNMAYGTVGLKAHSRTPPAHTYGCNARMQHSKHREMDNQSSRSAKVSIPLRKGR